MASTLESPEETAARIAAAAAEGEPNHYEIGTPEYHNALLRVLTLHRKYLDLRAKRLARAD